MTDSQLSQIIHQIENELYGFSNELNKLSILKYPTDVCGELIKYLENKLKQYHVVLKTILKEKDDDQDSGETQRKIITRIHNPLIQQDNQFLDWLKNAQTSQVPWSFVPSIEELAKKIIPDKKLVVYCANNYNYNICWSNSEKIAPYSYCVLALPKLHRVNVLWHVLIGHELFHPKCDDFIIQHNQKVLEHITEKVSVLHKSLVQPDEETLFTETEKNKRIDNLSHTVHTAWIRATEELLCDMACVSIFGPAAILAMRSFTACSPMDEMPSHENNFYPPLKYRFENSWSTIVGNDALQKLLSGLNDLEVKESLCNEINEIEKLASESDGERLVNNNHFLKIAYEEVKALKNEAALFVKEALSGLESKWDDEKVIAQIPILVQRLKKGIPPNEIVCEIVANHGNEKYKTQSADVVAILISGWIYETYWQRHFTEGGEIMRYHTMSRLLLKACEDSNLREC